MNGERDKSGKSKRENAVNSVSEIPIEIIKAMALINQATEDELAGTASDRAMIRTMLREAYAHLDSVMIFIAGGNGELHKLALTDGQQEYLRYVFEQFAAGEEIVSDAPNPTVVSMV